MVTLAQPVEAQIQGRGPSVTLDGVRSARTDQLRDSAQALASVSTEALQNSVSREQYARFVGSAEFKALSPETQRGVLTQLNDIARSELHGTLTGRKAELLESLMMDIVPPRNLNQGRHGTCTVAAASALYSQQNPEQYLAIMHQLSTSGAARLAGGAVIELQPESLARDQRGAQTERRLTERLFQTSMMQYAIGPDATYDPKCDMSVGMYQGKEVQFSGLFRDQYERAVQQLFGKGFDVRDASVVGRDQLVSQICDQVAKSGSTMIEIRNERAGKHVLHFVVVTGVSDGQVEYYDARKPGEIQRQSIDWLKNRVSCAMIEDGSGINEIGVPPPLQLATPTPPTRTNDGVEVYEVHQSEVMHGFNKIDIERKPQGGDVVTQEMPGRGADPEERAYTARRGGLLSEPTVKTHVATARDQGKRALDHRKRGFKADGSLED